MKDLFTPLILRREVFTGPKICGERSRTIDRPGLPAEALAKEGEDKSEFYACPVVSGAYPVDSFAVLRGCTTGVRLIGNEADCEEIRKERKQ